MKKINYLIIVLIIFLCLGNIPALAVSRKIIKPKITLTSAFKTEYKSGERITFQVKCPNFKSKVQYRVILYNVYQKTKKELWPNAPGYYYNKVIPLGYKTFPVSFSIKEPGLYNITILAKRAGAKVSYDSYVKSKNFKVSAIDMTLNKEGMSYAPSSAGTFNNVFITSNNIKLKNVNINGNLMIDPGKNGSANIENVCAATINILSGGQDSIHLNNVKSHTLLIQNKFNPDPVRVELSGSSYIESTTINSNSILDTKEGSFGTIHIKKGSSEATSLKLYGKYESSIIVENDAVVEASDSSSIAKLQIITESKDNLVTLKGSFNLVQVIKEAKVYLDGTINNIDLFANVSLVKSGTSDIKNINKNGYNVNIGNESTGSTGNNSQPANPGSGTSGGTASAGSPIIIQGAGVKLCTNTVPASTYTKYLIPSNSNEYYLDLSNEAGQTSITHICITVSKNATVTFSGLSSNGNELLAGQEMQLTFHDINSSFVDNPPPGITLASFRSMADATGYIKFTASINDGIDPVLTVKINIKVK